MVIFSKNKNNTETTMTMAKNVCGDIYVLKMFVEDNFSFPPSRKIMVPPFLST